MSLDPLAVHRNLMRSLPVRTILCPDTEEEKEPLEATPVRMPPVKRNTRPQRLPKPAGYTSAIQRVEMGERRMLSKMMAGTWYSAKHLSALAGMQEKSFYTHVRRMVVRGQLVRSGTRHWFRYRKT